MNPPLPPTDAALVALESRVDSDYLGLFPAAQGWQLSMFHALLGYEQVVSAHGLPPVGLADAYKFATMHYARWGCSSPSVPMRGIPAFVGRAAIRDCSAALRHAQKYVGVWFAFIAAHQGICPVSVLRSDRLMLEPNSRWFAYDALDSMLHDMEPEEVDFAAGINAIRPAFTGERRPPVGPTISGYSVRVGPEETSEFERAVFTGCHVLAESWSLDGIPIRAFRLFWAALSLAQSVREPRRRPSAVVPPRPTQAPRSREADLGLTGRPVGVSPAPRPGSAANAGRMDTVSDAQRGVLTC